MWTTLAVRRVNLGGLGPCPPEMFEYMGDDIWATHARLFGEFLIPCAFLLASTGLKKLRVVECILCCAVFKQKGEM